MFKYFFYEKIFIILFINLYLFFIHRLESFHFIPKNQVVLTSKYYVVIGALPNTLATTMHFPMESNTPESKRVINIML